ncbi:MAG TPA: TIGR00282 family metallophosphoesterase [Candidatus Obscuribacter sp.]|nr:TIGR00282 family metallophosphoesterase [Candidatus Obscuribacter sp.]HNB14565.1 TIGR00282 family metallophosphoesterase [Candidatus Obscuribacter sp.]HND04993.1 TIGR00282 family metallophosphoesterase [Candidatus Obscuribacter sp.]HND66833.1 TIGR00282 family metallophosphoesterase [Candidatus Obscuribacter sp.]HNG17887.1 TIGR00282 family metallophosphoesterase [Candidatus Obscuribacter sp.]
MQQLQSNPLVSILFLGDVIGKPGRLVVKKYLQQLKDGAEQGLKPFPDFVVVNVENACHGFGVSRENIQELKECGVDVFSGGNHTFDRKEIFDFIDSEETLLRPANYPEGTAGKGLVVVEKEQVRLAVINLMGRVFMEPLQSPFAVVDKLLNELQEKDENCLILVDVHAEATAEKVALGWYLDGRVQAVVGSHTHVQTADERLLKQGTAYITDAGACGPRDGVIGMAQEGVFRRMIKQLPSRFELAPGPAAACGVLIGVDKASKQAVSIERVRFEED